MGNFEKEEALKILTKDLKGEKLNKKTEAMFLRIQYKPDKWYADKGRREKSRDAEAMCK